MRILFLIFTLSYHLIAQDILTGIVKPIYDIQLSVSTDGIISKLFLKEGDRVKKNQAILKLDDNLQILETIRRKLVLDDTTQLNSLKETLTILKELLDRKEKLYKTTKAISLSNLNQLRMQYINIRGEIETLKANEKKEEVEYKIAKKVLNYYQIKSPINGIITEIKPMIGEWVQVGEDIINIVNIDTCFVEIDMEIDLVKRVSIKSKVTIIFDNNIEKKGKIGFISAVADSASGLVRAKVFFKNRKNSVLPGTTAQIIF